MKLTADCIKAHQPSWQLTVVLVFFLATLANGQDVEPAPALPIPAHPGRVLPSPANSRPSDAQPQREVHAGDAQTSNRRSSSYPVPGHPARGLQSVEDAEDSGESQEAAGLLRRIPHELHQGGVIFEYIYTGETFTKAHGGLSSRTVTNYRSNLDLVMTINTDAMNWWSGGRFFVYGQNLAGKPISQSDVGDVQLFSNLDSTISSTERPQFTTVAEYWYEHNFIDNLFRTKVGKQDANADFAYSDLGSDFVHSSFGLPPMTPLPTFPSQALGVAAFATITDTLVLAAGAYDGTPASGPTGVRWGFDTLGSNGYITLYQAEWKPQFGRDEQLPHTSRFGMWHHSADDLWVELNPTSPRLFTQNYGLWYILDQMLWKEGGSEDDQGLGGFLQFGWAPSNRNFLTEYYGAGLVYKGLIPQRDNDLLGIGVANVLFSSGLQDIAVFNGEAQGKQETAVELFYKMGLTPFISIQPDVQFISKPSGIYKDAFVPGLRFELVL